MLKEMVRIVTINLSRRALWARRCVYLYNNPTTFYCIYAKLIVTVSRPPNWAVQQRLC
jgi:hypothetical protein